MYNNRANVANDSARAFVNLQKFTGYATSVYPIENFGNATSAVEYRHHSTVLATAYETPLGGTNIIFTDCGGYRSVTTKARVNAMLREFGFYLTSERGEWFVGSELHSEEIPFCAGLSLEMLREINRTIRTEQRERNEKREAAQAEWQAQIDGAIEQARGHA